MRDVRGLNPSGSGNRASTRRPCKSSTRRPGAAGTIADSESPRVKGPQLACGRLRSDQRALPLDPATHDAHGSLLSGLNSPGASPADAQRCGRDLDVQTLTDAAYPISPPHPAVPTPSSIPTHGSGRDGDFADAGPTVPLRWASRGWVSAEVPGIALRLATASAGSTQIRTRPGWPTLVSCRGTAGSRGKSPPTPAVWNGADS